MANINRSSAEQERDSAREATRKDSGSAGADRESTSEHGEPTHEEIAARAYECWQERGGAHGSPEVDWQRAEEELRSERTQAAQKPKAASAAA